MGRRKNNPSLVKELIDGRWTMDHDEFTEKYNSLSSSDMSKVADAIDGMEEEFFNMDDDDDDDEDPGVYRSYSDYLRSGGLVDPCEDALWLDDL